MEITMTLMTEESIICRWKRLSGAWLLHQVPVSFGNERQKSALLVPGELQLSQIVDEEIHLSEGRLQTLVDHSTKDTINVQWQMIKKTERVRWAIWKLQRKGNDRVNMAVASASVLSGISARWTYLAASAVTPGIPERAIWKFKDYSDRWPSVVTIQ